MSTPGQKSLELFETDILNIRIRCDKATETAHRITINATQ
jgi:hypothetical protein